ncbi:hypothetical protein [Cedecea sp. P7760]|uniref:hypothetical protein n=1 Tax=Cedecea sp. P7760 TaxID=2726983 RepID=UPI0015A40F9D|nr:hypothetical protein [Cedecea sp. P7760]NWC65423.1 hypothetical protein [Cedecea sp. P7760]
MKNNNLNICDVISAATYSRQLNALLQNIFINGAEGCEKDNELLGLAYDIAGKVCIFMDKLEKENNK